MTTITTKVTRFRQYSNSRVEHRFFAFPTEIDTRAIAIITNCCPNLVSFGLHNCEFLDSNDDTETLDGEFRAADRSARLAEERETKKLLIPLLDLDVVKIVSLCPSKFVQFVLSLCYNVREIFIGMSTGISDDVIGNVLVENRLSRLEKLTVQNSKNLTMQGIEFLLANCENLKEIKYLENCDRISVAELEAFKRRVKENNWDLVLEDNCGNVGHDSNFMKHELKASFPAVQAFLATS